VSTWGVLASPEVWEVVKNTWDGEVLPLGFVSYSPEDTTQLLAEGGVSFLLVEARADLLSPLLVTAADNAGVELVALITSPLAEDVAGRMGVDKRVRQPEDLTRLGPGGSVATPTDTPPAGVRGIVVAVWGPTGSPGRTTIATSLAVLCASQSLATVLIDADSRSGSIAPALGLLDEVPGFVAACRLADRLQLDREGLTRLSHHYEVSGRRVDVLSGVNGHRIHPEVTPETIRDVISVAKSLWDVIIVDTGSDGASPEDTPHAAQWVVTTMVDLADDFVALCWASPVGVARFARVFDDVMTRRARKPLRVLINGVDTSRRSLSDEAALREALRRFAGVDTPGVIPRDGPGVRKAEMAGLALPDAEGNSPVVKGLGFLVSGWATDVKAKRARFTPHSGNPQRPAQRKKSRGPHASSSVFARLRILWDRLTPLR